MTSELSQFRPVRPGLRRVLHPLVMHRSHYSPARDPRVLKTAEQGERIEELLDEIERLRAERYPERRARASASF